MKYIYYMAQSYMIRRLQIFSLNKSYTNLSLLLFFEPNPNLNPNSNSMNVTLTLNLTLLNRTSESFFVNSAYTMVKPQKSPHLKICYAL